LSREKALLDTASEKNGPIDGKFWGLENQRAVMRRKFGPFGPQNRLLGTKGTNREKRPDWLAERVRFELAVPFGRFDRPHKLVCVVIELDELGTIADIEICLEDSLTSRESRPGMNTSMTASAQRYQI
jgi:hypothetical protein